ncbi:PrsW family glutamic-type intramembrane protease [Cerasicoccus maritimus]|uniref:PrsW family glutamic-type intramembrane protease n=1 Tax=Cerasicoccus maritimus TaxID=490089 RepID=UPI0028527AE6|nr:PrsW family glutamic-type intramembrane protease [Cerasicoccus maritimus]
MRFLIRNLPRLSYQTSFLVKTAVLLIALGFGAGMLSYSLDDDAQFRSALYFDGLNFESPLLDLANTIDDTTHEPEDFAHYLQFLTNRAQLYVIDDNFMQGIEETKYPPDQKQIARLLAQSLKANSASPELLALSNQTPPAPYSNFALAQLWEMQGFGRDAGRAYEAEALITGDNDTRQLAIDAYLNKSAFRELVRLLDDPNYSHLLVNERSYLEYQRAVIERDWPQIVLSTVVLQYDDLVWQIVLITLLTGAAWYVFLIHAGSLWPQPKNLAICAFAILLGMMSAMSTLLAITVQEDYLGFTEKYDLIGGLLYCIAGIGLREELLKLLFFMPMLPILLRKKDPLLALVVAGCVGLGFAVEENLSYLHQSDGMSGPARFLTANFLHISATALTGYALYRAFLTKWRELDYFASMFGLIVFAHGLYDAFLMLPNLMEFSIFSMTIYVLMCYQMFQIMEQIRPHGHRRVSLSFVFTASLSAVLAVSLGWSTAQIGMDGLRALGVSVVAVGVIVIMFFRVINEPIR